MKGIWKYVLLGILLAIGGLFVGELAGMVFSGMEWDNAVILGYCMYLCAVIVTCAGAILCKLEHPQELEHPQSPGQAPNDESDREA